nr:3381_t:CDS:2 [Entrophospora candida]
MSIPTKSTSLVNRYIHRTATIDKPCFICNKYTTAVLREENGADWFYVCLSHLNDRGFASPIPEPVPPVQIANKTSKTTDKEEKDKKDKEDNKDKDNKDINNKDNDNTDEKKKDDDKEKSKDVKKKLNVP